jgi:hypothetical protein
MSYVPQPAYPHQPPPPPDLWFTYSCPGCGEKELYPKTHCGTKTCCKYCGATFALPSLSKLGEMRQELARWGCLGAFLLLSLFPSALFALFAVVKTPLGDPGSPKMLLALIVVVLVFVAPSLLGGWYCLRKARRIRSRVGGP